MLSIRTVLCPVDFSPVTARQVDVAADLARAFGARFVLHHNMQLMFSVPKPEPQPQPANPFLDNPFAKAFQEMMAGLQQPAAKAPEPPKDAQKGENDSYTEMLNAMGKQRPEHFEAGHQSFLRLRDCATSSGKAG